MHLDALGVRREWYLLERGYSDLDLALSENIGDAGREDGHRERDGVKLYAD